jgi:hypothetical protein
MRSMFPIFRAHPLFLQILLSFGMHDGITDWVARAINASIGLPRLESPICRGGACTGTRPALSQASCWQ